MALIEVKIPPLGESISSGILAKWHVADGDTVRKDQPLFELETDKITSEGTAEVAGRISLRVTPGTEVKIGQVVATLDTTVSAAAPAAGSAPASTPAAASAAAPKAPTAPLSPAARRVAEETGVDPASIPGSGKGGRVTKGDLLAAAAAASASAPASVSAPVSAPAPAAAPTPAATPAAPVPTAAPGARQSRRRLSPLRKRIAERLVQAQHEAAMLTTFNEVDMSAVMALRARYQDEFVKRHGLKLGFMSFFTKAVVHALREVPAINAQFAGDEIVQNHYFDIGVAVSTEKGLMVPIIRNADQLGMAGIEQAIAEAAKKARDGKIALSDLEGGVFTITNGGIFGSMLSTPILNSPQSAILGLHAINERPVAVAGQVVIRPMMYLALSYDHRLVDGREAVTFLVKIKQAIEDPSRLLLAL